MSSLINEVIISDSLPVISLNSCQEGTEPKNYVYEWPELLEKPEPTVYAQDPLVEFNIGNEEKQRPIMVSGLLIRDQQDELAQLVAKHQDCLAWDYTDMPGLDRKLIEHRLPIKPNYRPVKQAPRRFNPELMPKITEEIKKLLDAKFIRPCRYAEWLSNIVPVTKKNGKMRVCIDFRDLNLATPKDEYTMPIADMLIDAAAGHKILSLMDGYAGYNQINLAEEDIAKTAFRCPGAIGIYEWVVMPFGLKNAGATYQRAMNTIFHDLIGKTLEVYIDDVIIKSSEFSQHLVDLEEAFVRMRKYNLKMNPTKCAFGVSAGNFLGFLIHQRGIEVDANKAKAIITIPPPRTIKEVQSLLGKVNYLRRFIANAAGKMKPLTKLLKGKIGPDIEWGPEQDEALEVIKHSLINPPVLVPPRPDKRLKLYLASSDVAISCLLAQDWDDGKERAIYYLSKTLAGPELNYHFAEKLCFSLVYACTKLEHYILPRDTDVVSKYNVVKFLLKRPRMKGRLLDWAVKLIPFSLNFIPIAAVKGQVVAEFLADHAVSMDSELDCEIESVETLPWVLHFDGSSTSSRAGAGVSIEGPGGQRIRLYLELGPITNNSAEYEALILGLETLVMRGVQTVIIRGDSQLVINQVLGAYGCKNSILMGYQNRVHDLLAKIADVTFEQISRNENEEANRLAQLASKYRPKGEIHELTNPMPDDEAPQENRSPERMDNPISDTSVNTTLGGPTLPLTPNNDTMAPTPSDWRSEIIAYFKNPQVDDRKLKVKALRFTLMGDDLYKRTIEDVLLLCLGPIEAMKVMAEVHEGICGAHRAGLNMRWTIHRYGYYWPTIYEDCIKYAQGCEACQKHASLRHIPVCDLNYMIKPWPFKSWAIDVIGMIHPPSSKGHKFIIVAADYFTKWVEAIPLKSVAQKDVIDFIDSHIIHRYGIPHSITTDRGTVFVGEQFTSYISSFKIKLYHSSPYYPQANGQAESANKILINIIKKMIEDKPRKWHENLSTALWACRNTKSTATGFTPYRLTYGQDAVLPMEVTVPSSRTMNVEMVPNDVHETMLMRELEQTSSDRLKAIDNMEREAQRRARYYNKWVRANPFHVGDLVWKTVLPLQKKNDDMGKWSPNWEGPYIIQTDLGNGVYALINKDGKQKHESINARYLKKYFPSYWEVNTE